jgi:hypothetical protein
VSRLDSFIRRLEAQRDCLVLGARLIAEVPGPVLEFGLGNGRTYDHLRELLPGREIYVFDRRIAAHPECIPDPEHMLLGELHESLPRAAERIRAPAALAHFDIGLVDASANAALCAFVAQWASPLMAKGGVVAADQEIAAPGWLALPLPKGVAECRYYMYRVSGATRK